jgi:flagellar hook-length control protein FliK
MQDTRWGEAFSERVVWVTGQQVQTAQIHVEPPQLGPIEVRVSIVNDQANLLFTAPHGVARDAIQMSLPRLQEMLVDSGLTLGNVSVGAHTPGSDQGRYRDSPGASGSATREVGIDSSGRQSITALRRGVGLVDLFA